VRDLDQIRTFLTGAGPVAIVDLPWIPVFLAICFLIHPWLGLVATVGGIVLFTMTLLTERSSRAPARLAAQEAGVRSVLIEAGRHGSETVVAMGMAGALAQRWAEVNTRYIKAVGRMSDVGKGLAAALIKLLRDSPPVRSRANKEISPVGECEDYEGARPHCTANTACARRRGNRVNH
jgi:ATP-binding cassette, subfamily C, bacterial PrsD